MKLINLLSHIRNPAGAWFRVCGGRCGTLATAFTHFEIVEARSK